MYYQETALATDKQLPPKKGMQSTYPRRFKERKISVNARTERWQLSGKRTSPRSDYQATSATPSSCTPKPTYSIYITIYAYIQSTKQSIDNYDRNIWYDSVMRGERYWAAYLGSGKDAQKGWKHMQLVWPWWKWNGQERCAFVVVEGEGKGRESRVGQVNQLVCVALTLTRNIESARVANTSNLKSLSSSNERIRVG